MSDAAGRIHILDPDLNVIRSSPFHQGAQPFYAIICAGDWIVGRDKLGNVARWDAKTLELTHWLDATATCDTTSLMPDEDPSLTISRGIAEHKGKIYLNNGFLQLLVMDLETFAVDEIRMSPTGDTPIEWISVEHPTIHAVTDKDGRLFMGDLPTNSFPTVLQLDDKSNLHRVRYDKLHDRFWVIQDEGDGEFASVSNGVVTVSTGGVAEQQHRFALDDVECLDISDDGRFVYAGGFDGVLQEFDNTTTTLTPSRVLGPFTHQISDLAVFPDNSLYVLSQDGVLVHISADGDIQRTFDFARQCIWDFAQRQSSDGHLELIAATDDGVAIIRPSWGASGRPHFDVVDHLPSGHGFSRRVETTSDGGYVVITRDCFIICYDIVGTEIWNRKVDQLIHTVAVSPDGDRIAVASNAGGIEYNAHTGEQLRSLTVDGSPLWGCTYSRTNDLLLATHAGTVGVFNDGSRSPTETFEIGDYPKRMWISDEGTLVVAGGGGVREIDWVDDKFATRRWSEALSNTCENAVVLGNFVYAVTYDSQIGVYEYASGEFLGVVEGALPDFPKAMQTLVSETGDAYLIIGGRGGYIATFQVEKDGSVIAQQMQWLPRSCVQPKQLLEQAAR